MSDNTFSTLHTLVDQLISQNQALKAEKETLEQELVKVKDDFETMQLELMELEENYQNHQSSINSLVSKLQQAAS